MNPIQINIEVNLGEKTLDILKTLAPALGVSATPAPAAPAPVPVPEPEKPAPAQAPSAPVADDLPPDDAPDPTPSKPTPTEDDARQAVKAARSRGVTAKVIKDLMRKSFGIESSVECPAEKRQELIDELNKLAA